jgi:transcriptional regulator with XRE-family HTH domain/quercetin dioxygenase-like cupin family protein
VARSRGSNSAPEYGVMGDRLREARQARGISLRTLAEQLGVSPSLISQVETGRARPSVSTLYAIVNALGVSLDELLFTDAGLGAPPGPPTGAPTDLPPDAPPDPGQPWAPMPPEVQMPADPVQRAATRKVIRLASGVVWERLTTASMPNFDFLHVTYEVGGASSPERDFQRHGGQEWGYIMSGTLGVRIGFEEYLLGPGDAIGFDSSTPHRLYNAGDEPVHGIWFVLGRRSADFVPAPEASGGRDQRRT